MKNYRSTFFTKFVACLTLVLLSTVTFQVHSKGNNTNAIITTNLGVIELDLFDSRAPKTVENFINYVNKGFYNDTVFHRVIPNFMIQGGGFDKTMTKKATDAPIKNEANAFIPNLRGTISMARTNDPHSATSQFFINVKDNASLNKSNYNPGYAVFGKVTKGMNIADKISKVKTKAEGYMRDIPVESIIIESIVISKPSTESKSPKN
jgi:cyclophilin family peptidyl-prolyl cis-trans isomerase